MAADLDDRATVLQTVRSLNANASALTQRGDLGGARRRLEEARSALQQLPDDNDPERLGVSASVHEGKGQLALGVGKLEEAQLQLMAALRDRGRQEAASGKRYDLQVAIGKLNLASALGQMQRPDEAIPLVHEALGRLEGLDEGETGPFFYVTALQTLAMLHAARGARDEALPIYDRAIAKAQDLYDDGLGEIAELLTQLKITASVSRYQAGDFAIAARLSTEAAEEAWAVLDVTGTENALTQYCTAQMNLVAFAEAAGTFSDAEDALFKVLKLVGPQHDVIARGQQLYASLLALPDEVLEAGNLPRDEIEESVAELTAMSEALGERDANDDVDDDA